MIPCLTSATRGRALTVCLIAAACGTTHAQIGTGTFSWQLSLDDGATWQSGVVDAPFTQQRVHVRAQAAWQDPESGYAFRNALFDATWISQSTGGLGDVATDLLRPAPFDYSGPVVLGASRFGPVIKIDDTRDTAPPGLGSRWVPCGQIDPGFEGPFSTANPATVFTYTMTLDGMPGDRTAGAIFLESTTPNRFMSVYLRGGSFNRPLMMHNTATLRVVPTPSAFATLGIGALALARRRR